MLKRKGRIVSLRLEAFNPIIVVQQLSLHVIWDLIHISFCETMHEMLNGIQDWLEIFFLIEWSVPTSIKSELLKSP